MSKDINILKTKIKIPDSTTENLIVLTRSAAQVFYKNVIITLTPIVDFKFFEIFVTIEANQCTFSMHNLGEHLVNFTRNDVNDLPIILDAIMNLYHVEYFETRQIDANTNVLVYHSIFKQKSRQLFKIRKARFDFNIHFFDKAQTTIRFNFIQNQIILPNENPIELQNVMKIVLYFDVNEKRDGFTHFAMETFLKNGDVRTLIEIELKEVYHYYLYNSKIVFPTVIELIEKLQEQPELENIPIKLEIQ